jgi:hypothetical protein
MSFQRFWVVKARAEAIDSAAAHEAMEAKHRQEGAQQSL